MLIGAVWQPGKELFIDAAYRRVRVEDVTGHEFRAGVTFSFGLSRS